ncbi:MAG: hypothetical protein ACFFG0_06835 [Candidatus Thorarchaeota archaeon]
MVEKLNQTKKRNNEELKGTPLLWNQNNIIFKEPLKDVHTAALTISGCAWIDTDDGLVLIDTMSSESIGKKIFERIL